MLFSLFDKLVHFLPYFLPKQQKNHGMFYSNNPLSSDLLWLPGAFSFLLNPPQLVATLIIVAGYFLDTRFI